MREIGASNFSAPRLAESLKISTEKGLPRYQSLQPQYSLVERAEFEGPLEELCLKEKIGVIGYYSLASGFLTGKYRSKADTEGRARGPRVEKYLNDYGFGVIKALDEVAARYKAKPGQIALAWLIARPSVTAPIASATNLEQLAELVEAARDRTGCGRRSRRSTRPASPGERRTSDAICFTPRRRRAQDTLTTRRPGKIWPRQGAIVMKTHSAVSRRFALAGGIGLLASPAIRGRAAAATRGVSDTEIIIGTMTDLSGVTAVQGVNNANAMRMAFDEANAAAAFTAAR